MKWVGPAAALGLIYALTRTGERMQSTRPPNTPPSNVEGLARAAIAAAAKRHGVPVNVALAYAWLESRFKPDAKGDLSWATWGGGERYRKHVLQNPKFANNPFRSIPALWHSYGLFQLLAPHFCGANEDPRVLFDPDVNADRGCKYIATCLRKAAGDPRRARLYYAGATKLAEPTQRELLAKVDEALKRFPV